MRQFNYQTAIMLYVTSLLLT